MKPENEQAAQFLRDALARLETETLECMVLCFMTEEREAGTLYMNGCAQPLANALNEAVNQAVAHNPSVGPLMMQMAIEEALENTNRPEKAN